MNTSHFKGMLAIFAIYFFTNQAFSLIKPTTSAPIESKSTRNTADVSRGIYQWMTSRDINPIMSSHFTKLSELDKAGIVYRDDYEQDSKHERSRPCAYSAAVFDGRQLYQSTMNDWANHLTSWSVFKLKKLGSRSEKLQLFGPMATPSLFITLLTTTVTGSEENVSAVVAPKNTTQDTKSQDESESTQSSEGSAGTPGLKPAAMLLLGLCLLGIVAFSRKVISKE